MAAIIDFKHVNKYYGKFHALKDINLSIEEGQVVSIIGPSGSGKSTLIRTMNGLERINSGTLMVTGYDLADKHTDLNKIRKNVGMVFQHFNLYDNHTVLENITLAPKIVLHRPDKENNDIAMDLLKKVGLEEKANMYPRQLSGGQKQRVAVARALTMDPKILLCDEATSALDPKTTNSILDLLMEINQKLGITVIIVTHQMEVVRKACNKACILENGKIADEGSVKEIFIKQPQSLKRLLGEEQVKLPKEGHNIQIAHLVNDMHDGELFAKMSAELNYIFPIIDGKIQDYQNDSMGIFTINVDDEHLKLVTDYLTKEGLNWHEIEEQHDETKEDEE